MIRWLGGLWPFWVALCARREGPLVLALIRIALCAVLLWDLAWVAIYGLPTTLWAPQQAGGVIDVYAMKHVPLVYWAIPAEAAPMWGTWVAWGLWSACVLTLGSFMGGLLTRWSGLAFVLLYAQTAWINDTSDRGIDRMIRIVMLLLVVSGSGKALSLDARLRTGRWLGDGASVSALPRYLIIGQLVLMYWCAGIEKFALSWFPWGDYGALYLILQDPILAVHDGAWFGLPGLFQLTQLGTAVSHMWEWGAPLLLVAYWFRLTRTRSGRLRAFCNANDVRVWYVLIGLVFHLLLAGSLHLGIFPLAMVCMYPAFFHPDELAALGRRSRARILSKLGKEASYA